VCAEQPFGPFLKPYDFIINALRRSVKTKVGARVIAHTAVSQHNFLIVKFHFRRSNGRSRVRLRTVYASAVTRGVILCSVLEFGPVPTPPVVFSFTFLLFLPASRFAHVGLKFRSKALISTIYVHTALYYVVVFRFDSAWGSGHVVVDKRCAASACTRERCTLRHWRLRERESHRGAAE
jgi:hypothetical protein